MIACHQSRQKKQDFWTQCSSIWLWALVIPQAAYSDQGHLGAFSGATALMTVSRMQVNMYQHQHNYRKFVSLCSEKRGRSSQREYVTLYNLCNIHKQSRCIFTVFQGKYMFLVDSWEWRYLHRREYSTDVTADVNIPHSNRLWIQKKQDLYRQDLEKVGYVQVAAEAVDDCLQGKMSKGRVIFIFKMFAWVTSGSVRNPS